MLLMVLVSVLILVLPSTYGARLFISEYVQNSATTWAIEVDDYAGSSIECGTDEDKELAPKKTLSSQIFNPSCHDVEQASYALMFAPDGGAWLRSSIVTFSSGTMAPNSTHIVCSTLSCNQVITGRALDGDDAVYVVVRR